MINKIISGISSAIYNEFKDDVTDDIYIESVEQGLKEPSFSIVLVEPSKELFLQGKDFTRHHRTNQFCIYYFPSGKVFTDADGDPVGKMEEINTIVERLFDCLEVIKIGDSEKQIRGTSMHCEISDQVLAFMVVYDFFDCKVVEPDNAMETLEQNRKVKNNEEEY